VVSVVVVVWKGFDTVMSAALVVVRLGVIVVFLIARTDELHTLVGFGGRVYRKTAIGM
jgi:hypothetical protein